MWSASPIWSLHTSRGQAHSQHSLLIYGGRSQIPVSKSPLSLLHIRNKAYFPRCLVEVCVLAIYKNHSLIIFEAFSILWSNCGQRFQLIAFLLLGLIFTIIHHLLGNHLSGKPVSQVVSFGPWTLPIQLLASPLSNVLSQIVKWLLASTIAIAFAQYFWRATKSYDDCRKLDAPLAAANGNPFTFSAFPTWWRSPGLAFSALTMMTMIFIPIFVPGSIRVITASGLTQPCTVNFPNISNLATIYTDGTAKTGGGTGATTPHRRDWEFQTAYTATTRTTALVNRVIVGGSYLPVPNPCDVCVYRVNFTAPSLKCSSDINATYDFSTNLPPTDSKSDTCVPILNGTLGSNYALTVATRDGVAPYMNPPVAVRCHAFRADYDVRVRHDNFSSQIDVLNVTSGSRLSPSLGTEPDPLELALDGLVQAFVNAFKGSVIFDSQCDGFAGTPLSVAYSLMHWAPTVTRGNHHSVLTWSDLTTSLPQLMQNISLSLLSGQFPSYNQTYMVETQTECSMTKLVYEYKSSRLLAIYAIAWAAAAIFFALGFLFIWKNREEHNLDFSHVVDQLHLGPYSQVPLLISEGSRSGLSTSTWRDMPPLRQSHLDSESVLYSYSPDFPYS